MFDVEMKNSLTKKYNVTNNNNNNKNNKTKIHTRSPDFLSIFNS